MTQNKNNTKKSNAQKSKANTKKALAPKKPTVADIAKAQEALVQQNEAQYKALAENDDRILDAIIATGNANRSGFAQLGENQGTIARSLENHEAGEVERFNKLKKLIESISGFGGLSGVWMGVTFVLMILAVVVVIIVMGISGATALEIIFASVGIACAVMAFSLFAAMAKGR